MTSTSTSVELVKDLYAAFGRGDIGYILSHDSPDWQWTNAGEGIPSAGSYTGPAGVAEFFHWITSLPPRTSHRRAFRTATINI